MKKILFFALAALALGFTGCVEDEPYAGISDVMQDPGAVTPTDEVTIFATVIGTNEAKLVYTVNGGAAQTVTMTMVDLSAALVEYSGPGTMFTGKIPAQADGAKVVWYVEAGGQKSTLKEYTVSAEVFDYTKLVMNEVDGVNKTIELFNTGTQTLPLTGCYLVKNEGGGSGGPGNSIWWTGEGASGTIAPGGYVIIKENGPAGFSGNAGISNGQNLKFELFAPDDTSLSVFTRGTPPWIQSSMSSANPNSYQRIPNGGDTWLMASPTNNAANPSTGSPIPAE